MSIKCQEVEQLKKHGWECFGVERESGRSGGGFRTDSCPCDSGSKSPLEWRRLMEGSWYSEVLDL